MATFRQVGQNRVGEDAKLVWREPFMKVRARDPERRDYF